MVGLDRVLPVIQGSWSDSPAIANGLPVEAGPFQVDMVWREWATPEVVVLAGPDVGAYDPVADLWRALPSLPPDVDPRVLRQVVAAGGGVYVVVGADAPQLTSPDVQQPSGWLLRGSTWEPATFVAGTIVGTCCEGLAVVVHASSSPEDTAVGSAVSVVDPSSGTITRLPDLPAPVEVSFATPVPDGFVLLGGHLEAADRGTLQRPAVLRWSWAQEGWSRLPDPPAAPGAATWVGGFDGPDGRLVAVGTAENPTRLTFMTLDLGSAAWIDEVVVPLDDLGVRRTGARGLAVAWDGARTVWAYGGYAASIHLAYGLPTGELLTARPTFARTGGELVWHDGRLVLYGGWGTAGQSTTVGVWQAPPRPSPAANPTPERNLSSW